MATNEPVAEPVFMSLADAALRIGFSKYQLRDMVNRGELRAYRLNDAPRSRIRVKVADVDALMRPHIPEAIFAAR